MAASLFLFHVGTNPGYAVEREAVLFYEVGLEISEGDPSRVHLGFRSLSRGRPHGIPENFKNVVAYDFFDHDPQNIRWLANYVEKNQIRLVMIYDIQPIDPLFKSLRKGGVQAILAYWGAPISSRMPFWKLAVKRLRLVTSLSRANGLIFQSRAMADLAVHGRGVPRAWIDIVYSGPDISVFRPSCSDYVYEALQLPKNRKVFVYSGHMQERKGVRTLVEAAIELLHRRQRRDVCFLICGNKLDESKPYEKMYAGLGLDGLIRFAGYRSDIANIFPTCFCGVTPSSGWDSLPRSPLEMAACGLPVIASRLDALPEVVLDRQTGLLFEPGNAGELADCIEQLLDRPELAAEYGRRGRQRCETLLNWENQRRELRDVCLKRLGVAPRTEHGTPL